MACHWHKNRYLDQWNRIENPEVNPHTDGKLIFKKGEAQTYNGEKTVCSASSFMKAHKLIKLEQTLTLCTKINPKQRLKPETRHHKIPRGECR